MIQNVRDRDFEHGDRVVFSLGTIVIFLFLFDRAETPKEGCQLGDAYPVVNVFGILGCRCRQQGQRTFRNLFYRICFRQLRSE
jgi:hypothetical protein